MKEKLRKMQEGRSELRRKRKLSVSTDNIVIYIVYLEEGQKVEISEELVQAGSC